MAKRALTLLIVIDLQQGFVTECSKHVLPKIEALQHAFDHVVFTKFYNPAGSPFREILDYQKLSPGDKDTCFALTPRADAVVIERPLYSCVTAELHAWLKQWDVKDAYICGIATEACVLKTVLDLFEHNIRPIVIEDCSASDQEQHYHDIAMELITKLIGRKQVVCLEDIKGV